MAAGGQIEAHERIAGLQQREEHRLIGLAARVRLDVGELAAEELRHAVDGELFGDVDELAAAIIAPARISLRVLVGHHRALRFQHGAGDDVLGSDQLDLVALTAKLQIDRAGDFGIGLREGCGEEGIGTDRGCGGC